MLCENKSCLARLKVREKGPLFLVYYNSVNYAGNSYVGVARVGAEIVPFYGPVLINWGGGIVRTSRV